MCAILKSYTLIFLVAFFEGFPLLYVFIQKKAEDSGFEAPTASESDKESENTKAIEGLSGNGKKKRSKYKKISPQSSSFIQNVLYEDSCTGVTVIDLFIALKSIKENLESLSHSNEKMSSRMNFLTEETETVWKEFVELVESMRMFLDKMNADVSNFKLTRQFSNVVPKEGKYIGETNRSIKKSENKNKFKCPDCGRNMHDINASPNKKLSCLGCLISTLKEKSLTQFPGSPETLLGSFLASVLYWQKNQEMEGKPKGIKSSSSTVEEITSDGSLSVKESTVQMICDICEILNVATVRERDESLPRPVVHLGNLSDSSSKGPEDTEDDIGWSSGILAASKQKHFRLGGKRGETSKEKVESRGELTSEGDSEFEEALTCHLNHHHDVKVKPSVTCMGDLSKAVTGKKSASTITPNNNIVSSWAGKLSDVIKSKIKQIKSKQKSSTNVKVFEEPFEKSETALKKLPGMLQFSITASTSAGVFDVTVVQYKKPNHLVKSAGNCNKNVHLPLGSSFPSPLLKDCKDEFWSDESIANSESESMETCSNFGDDDMGEFLEIYLENKDNAGSNENAPAPSPKKQIIGDLRNIEFKTGKTHFLEMHTWHPVYFVQEFIKKTGKTQQDEQVEDENVSTDASEEEIFPLNTSEKQEKQIVIQGSSSDLIIYIQVEIENDSGENSSCVLFDFEKSSLGTQTKENEPQTSSGFRERRAIRLVEGEHKGESLFNIWRAPGTNLASEAEDIDRVTFDEPFVVMEKPEEEGQYLRKNPERGKLKSVSFKENISEMFYERELQDMILEEAKMVARANVVILKEIKQSTPILHHQVAKHWKSETLRLKQKPKVSKEIIESINSSAGELKKALRLIREIENDIADAQFDDAISILPRLESELRKHLHTKMKGLEAKKTKYRRSNDNFFSSFDFGQRHDSVGGDSDESSEYRFNNLLQLLSNLENAVKANEGANDKIELSRYDSSKIYELLQALTDNIRELEEGPNAASLSQTLDIASQLDNAVREYDSIVKKQPADYLTPQERSRKRRSPRWSAAEEASVSKHLKNVRKKVFEMVEMEAVGMEDRIQRDFDRLDRLEMENDEAMMFLETLLQKTQKRMSEFHNLKTDLNGVFFSLNTLYDNFQKAAIREKEVKMKAAGLRKNSKRNSDRSLKTSPERISKRVKDKVSERKNPDRVLERKAGRKREKVLEKLSEKIPDMVSEPSLERISSEKLETSRKKVLIKNTGKNPDTISEQILERNLQIIPEISLNNDSERIPEDVLDKTLEKTSEKNSEKSEEKSLEKIEEEKSEIILVKTSEKIVEKIPDKNSEKIPERNTKSLESSAPDEIPEKIVESNPERNSEMISKIPLDGSLKTTGGNSENISKRSETPEYTADTISENKPENSERISVSKSERSSEEISDGNPEGIIEKSRDKMTQISPERSSRKTPENTSENVLKEEKPPTNSKAESPLLTPPEIFMAPTSQESLERIVSSFINAIDYLKSKSNDNKSEVKDVPPSQPIEQEQQLESILESDQLSSTIKEFKVIGQNSLYLSWTEPEGPLEGSILGYEVYVEGKLNQKVRNPQRYQAVLYSVDLSKEIQVQLYAVLKNNQKVLLASMNLNGD